MTFKRTEIYTLVAIVCVVIVVGLFTFLNSSNNNNETSEAQRTLGSSDSESMFTDIDGESFSLDQYQGRVRVVNSWASWSPFSVNELSDFIILSVENEDVVVIAINRKESNLLSDSFLKQFNSVGKVIFLQDPEDVFYKSIGGFSMPETVFYDKEGNISFHKRGFMSLEEMRKHTQDAFNKI